MLNVACCLWDANRNTMECSAAYDETWVEKLHRGFRRNLTIPFRFVVFTDRRRSFSTGIDQEWLVTDPPDYGCMIEPFKLNEPSIVVGLDTIILRNIDHMAAYCLEGKHIAVPRHPSLPDVTINPIVFVPQGFRQVFDDWNGENDMTWLGKQKPIATDAMWPHQILSLKLHDVRRKGTQGAHIIYFHGHPKPDEMTSIDWVQSNWV